MTIKRLTNSLLAAVVAFGTLTSVPAAHAQTSDVLDALPHVLWQYTFRDNGDQYNPRAERHYLTCTYVGPHGAFTVQAEFGRCAWLKRFGSENEGVIRHRT